MARFVLIACVSLALASFAKAANCPPKDEDVQKVAKPLKAYANSLCKGDVKPGSCPCPGGVGPEWTYGEPLIKKWCTKLEADFPKAPPDGLKGLWKMVSGRQKDIKGIVKDCLSPGKMNLCDKAQQDKVTSCVKGKAMGMAAGLMLGGAAKYCPPLDLVVKAFPNKYLKPAKKDIDDYVAWKKAQNKKGTC